MFQYESNERAIGSMQLNNGTSMWKTGMGTSAENTTTHADTSDTNDDFFGRPVKIGTVVWTPGISFYEVFDPWATFCEDPRVSNRLAHFKNLRGTLNVQALINGNPFYYGRAIMSYIPLPNSDSLTKAVADSQSDIIQMSQRPHVYLDPTRSEGGEIECPFIFPQTYLNIPTNDWRKMGKMVVTDINTLQHANDSSDTINITFFAYMTDLSLNTPTSIAHTTLTPQGDVEDFELQGDEYGRISMPAHTLANWAGRLANAPMIGAYARATELAANAVAGIASIFGYSRPRLVPADSMITRHFGETAVTNYPDTSLSVALDAKKEVTIDPRVCGLMPADEMALTPIAMRESYLTSFQMTNADPTGEHLFSMRVTPMHGDYDLSGGPVHLTPSAFVACPFTYWKGSMKIRLQAVCSAYHRGRVRVVWDPIRYNAGFGDIYNTNYSMVMDLNESQDITFCIGWGQDIDYVTVGDVIQIPTHKTSVAEIPTGSPNANGTLSIYVVNELTSPRGTATNIEFNVFTSMCDDFEVAGPTDRNIRRLQPIIRPPISVTEGPGEPGGSGPPLEGGENPDPPDPPDPPIQPPEDIVTRQLKRTFEGVWESDNFNEDNYVVGYYRDANNGMILDDGASGTLRVDSSGGLQTLTFFVQYPTSGGTTFDYVVTSPSETVTLRVSNSGIGAGTWDMVIDVPAGNNVPLDISFTRVSGGRQIITDITMPQNELMDEIVLDSGEIAALISEPTVEGGGVVSGSVEPTFITVPADHAPGTTITFRGFRGHSLDDRSYDFSTQTTGDGMVTSYVVPTGPTIAVTQDAFGSPPPWEFSFEAMIYTSIIALQGDELSLQGDETDADADPNDANAPLEATDEEVHMGPTSDLPGLNQIYFGEQVTSWRQVLKRFTGAYVVRSNSNEVSGLWPLYPGPVAPSVTNGIVMTPQLSLFTYVRGAYLCMRGGMRYKINSPIRNNMAFVWFGRESAEEVAIASPGLNYTPIPLSSGDFDGFTGAAWDSDVNKPWFEFESPSYSKYRFFPARAIGNVNRENFAYSDMMKAKTRTIASVNDTRIFAATAEDFSLAGFICTPLYNLLL